MLEENKLLELEIKKLREQLKTEREQATSTMHKFEGTLFFKTYELAQLKIFTKVAYD